jgi:hypothetical protein
MTCKCNAWDETESRTISIFQFIQFWLIPYWVITDKTWNTWLTETDSLHFSHWLSNFLDWPFIWQCQMGSMHTIQFNSIYLHMMYICYWVGIPWAVSESDRRMPIRFTALVHCTHALLLVSDSVACWGCCCCCRIQYFRVLTLQKKKINFS